MDNMPPLPEPALTHDRYGNLLLIGPCFTADQMHAYARAYAEQRCAPLVEALTKLKRYFPADIDMRDVGWGDSYINEACDAYEQARAALAAQEKHHG